MCVLSIKMPGNLFNDPCTYFLVYFLMKTNICSLELYGEVVDCENDL